jgi:hypothetical protein
MAYVAAGGRQSSLLIGNVIICIAKDWLRHSPWRGRLPVKLRPNICLMLAQFLDQSP